MLFLGRVGIRAPLCCLFPTPVDVDADAFFRRVAGGMGSGFCLLGGSAASSASDQTIRSPSNG